MDEQERTQGSTEEREAQRRPERETARSQAARPRDVRRLVPWMMARMLWTKRAAQPRERVRWRAAATGGLAALALVALVWLAWDGTMSRLAPPPGSAGNAGAVPGANAGGDSGAPEATPSEEAQPTLSKDGPARWLRPAEGRVVKPYGWAYAATFGDWRLHTGMDFQAAKGAGVVAAADGKVASVSETRLWGREVVIDGGGGWTAVYRGLSTVAVSEGEWVKAGQTIGAVAGAVAAEADEGAHLHWEVRHNGRPVDPSTLLTP